MGPTLAVMPRVSDTLPKEDGPKSWLREGGIPQPGMGMKAGRMDHGLICTVSSRGRARHSGSSELSIAVPGGTEPGWERRLPARIFEDISLLFEERKNLRALPRVAGVPAQQEGISHPAASQRDTPGFPAATGCPMHIFIS